MKLRADRMTENLTSTELQTMNKEIVWVYWAKAIGIFLVLWGHEIIPHILLSWIFSFHMPLFFFLSGYLTKNKHTIEFRQYIKKYAYSLLMPYLCLGGLAYLVWLVKNLLHPGPEMDSVSLWRPLWGMLYATGIPIANLYHSSPLWFLPALFSAYILHWIVKKITNGSLLYFIVAVILYYAGYFSFMLLKFRLPVGMENAMIGFLFFATGNIIHNRQTALKRYVFLFAAILFLAFQIVLLYLQNWPITSLLSGHIGNPLIYYITAMFGICSLVGFVSNLPKVAAVATISKNTVTIFTLQNTVKLFIATLLYFLGIQINSYYGNMAFGLGSSIFTLYTLSIFTDIVRKRCPVMLGEK